MSAIVIYFSKDAKSTLERNSTQEIQSKCSFQYKLRGKYDDY